MKETQNVNPPFTEEEYDEFDLLGLFHKLLAEWKLILKWCGVAAVAGLVIALSIPKEYTVKSKLAPETIAKSNTGSLGALAGLAGINLGAMNTVDAVYPDLYPDIISSTPFVVELFPVPVEFTEGEQLVQTDFYTYLKDYTRVPWWGKLFKAPVKAIHWFLGLFVQKDEEDEEAGFADLDPKHLTKEQDVVSRIVRESISLGKDKKTSIISLSVTAQDPMVAATISQEVIERLQTYVINYRTEKARKDLEYYQKLYDEARSDYYSSQQRYAAYVDRNQGVVLQRVKTEQERLQNEMNLNYQLFNTCAQQLQAAKATVQQETPVFTVINPPQVPLKRSKPSRATILAACVFFGFLLATVWILWVRNALASLRGKDKEVAEAEADEKAPAQS